MARGQTTFDSALAVAKDGSLLVADDTGVTIWRISYTGTHSDAGKRDH